MKLEVKKGVVLIDIEKGDKLLVTHEGSIRFLEIDVDDYDDIGIITRENLKLKKKDVRE